MNVFQTHEDIVGDYSSYIRSFISIADPEIRNVVNRDLASLRKQGNSERRNQDNYLSDSANAQRRT